MAKTKVINKEHLKEIIENNWRVKMNKELKCENILQVPIPEERPEEFLDYVFEEFYKLYQSREELSKRKKGKRYTPKQIYRIKDKATHEAYHAMELGQDECYCDKCIKEGDY